MCDSQWYSKKILAVVAIALVLGGCGGGSSSAPNPPPPPANVAPVANAGPDQTVDELAMVTLDGSGSTDTDGTVTSYAWTQTAGTDVVLDETAPAMPTFTTPDVAADETLTFSLVVTDNDGAASAADTVDIMVVANVAPTADAGPDQTVSSLDVVTLDGSGSTDSDGTIATYAWAQTTGTAVTLDETAPTMPTFVAPNVANDEILTFELVVMDDDGEVSLPDTVVVTINPSLALPFSDDFVDGDSLGWAFVDDSVTVPSSWDASSGRLVNAGRTNIRSGDNTETYRRGTFAVLSDSVNLTNYRFSVDLSTRPTVDAIDDLGVMFRYTDEDHYYRFSMNAESGSTRLESKAGVDINGDPIWRTLAHNFRGYEPGQSLTIEVEVDGPLIQVFLNGDHLFAAYDVDHSAGGIALYTRDGVRFDNVLITASSTDPEIVIVSPVADFVIPNGPRNVDVVAVARNVPALTGSVDIQFVGEAACGAVTETNPGVYMASCDNRAVGNHLVRAFIRDSGAEVDRDSNVDVFIGSVGLGDRWDAIGDSLTLGLYDNFSRDNLNLTDRKTISTRGWSGPLSDMLTTTLGQPNLVGNEGISGDRAWETRILRLDSIIERNKVPRSNRALVMLGTNDSNVGSPEPSGLGCVGAACDNTYKGEMIQIIQQLQGAGRDTVYLGILPPVFGDNTSTIYANQLDPGNVRQQTILEYNQVIITELSTMPDVVLGPDLFNCFLTGTVDRFSLFQDSLHMNSLGYALVAALWHDAITAGPVVPPMDPCPAPIYILDSLDAYTHGHKQNLLEAGEEYYNDQSFTLTSVPAELADGIWVSQNNADNTNTDASFLSFDAGPTPVTVYIAYDPAGGPPTSSTHTFAALGAPLSSDLTVSDGAVGTFALVEAAGVTGTVTIGGTDSDLSGIARQAYVVVVVP